MLIVPVSGRNAVNDTAMRVMSSYEVIINTIINYFS